MASKSLGTLTLDLVARTGGFAQGMDKAERASAKWRKQVEKDMKATGAAVAAAATVAVAGLATIAVSTAKSAQEISRQAALANATTEEFQRFAAGSKAVGIEQDKLADILKDVNDKVGDFLTTGGGGMADFFEKIAPQVGVTAEQFRNLSGPDALGLYVDTLEKAGAGQQEMTFHLEALASDATALLPLLRNNGEGMKLFADEAQRAGAILSQDTIKRANELNAAMILVDNSTTGFKNQISTAMIPVLADFAGGLSDVTRDGALAATVSDDLAEGFRLVAQGAAGTLAAIHLVSKSAKGLYDLNEASKGDGSWWETFLPPVRIYRAIESLDDIKESAGGTATELNELALGYGAFIEKLGGEGGSSGGDRIKRLAAFLEDFKSLQGGSSGVQSTAGAVAEAANAIDQQVKALENQAATLGMSAEALALYNLEQAKASDGQMLQARAALDVISAYETQKEQTEAYADLVASLRTEEEQLTDQMRERLAVLDAMQGLEPDERMQVAGRIAGAATTEAPEFGGLDASVGGPFGELLKIDEAEEKLQEWYDTQLEMLEQFRQERSDLSATWDEEELALKQQHEDALAQIEQSRQLAQLSAAESVFGDLTGIAKTFAGEQSGIYKAMFIAQKAAAIAQSMIAIQTGIAMAAANPWPTNLAAMASVAAATAGLVGNISAIGMAHEGIDAIPETGTWLLEKGERVTTAETSAKLDKTLSDIQSGGTGAPIVNLYEDASKAGQVNSRQEDGKNVIDIFVTDIMSDGKSAKAISRAFGVQRSGT